MLDASASWLCFRIICNDVVVDRVLCRVSGSHPQMRPFFSRSLVDCDVRTRPTISHDDVSGFILVRLLREKTAIYGTRHVIRKEAAKPLLEKRCVAALYGTCHVIQKEAAKPLLDKRCLVAGGLAGPPL